jgi:lysophospholipase L1-like esterase
MMQTENTKTKTHRFLHVLLWFSFVWLWCAATLLALEVVAKFSIHRVETTNTLILRGAVQDMTPATDIDALACTRGNSGLPPVAAGTSNTQANRDCSVIRKWILPGTNLDAPQAARAPDLDSFSQFSDLNDWQRELFARLQYLMVVEWTSQGEPVQAWGELKLFVGMLKDDNEPSGNAKTMRTLVNDVPKHGPQTVELSDHARCSAVIARDKPSTVYTFISREDDAQEAPADSIYRLGHKAYKPHLRNATSCTGYPMNTNDYGFRGNDVSIPKPAGVFRILCIGGSTTEEGPSDDRTYPAILEKLLRHHFAQPIFEIVNCGTGGTTTAVHLSRMADYLALQPNMVIFYEGVNDLRYGTCTFSFVSRALYKHILSRSCFVQYWCNRWMFPDHDTLAEAIQVTAIKNMRVLADAFRCNNIDVVFSTLATPDMEHLTRDERDYYDWTTRRGWRNTNSWADDYLTLPVYREMTGILNRQLQSLCKEESLLCVPMADCLLGGRDSFNDMVHMTNTAIERKACVFFSYLKDFLPTITDTRIAGH